MDVGCIGGEGERTNGRKKREKFGEEAEEKAGDEAYQTEKNGKQSHRRMGTKFLRCLAPYLTAGGRPRPYPTRRGPARADETANGEEEEKSITSPKQEKGVRNRQMK